MSKNKVIFILVLATLLGSVWGSIANRERKVLTKELQNTTSAMEKLTSQTTREREQVLGKTAGLQETLVGKEQQLAKARKELVKLRKTTKVLEAKISGCNATIVQLTKDKKALNLKLTTAREKLAGLADVKEVTPVSRKPDMAASVTPGDENVVETDDTELLQEQFQSAELAVERIQQRLDAANAQIIGLEKIIDEKTAAMNETGQEMDRLQINMDVLLSKIADQRDELQELRDENRELIKELSAKNEELSDLMEEMMQQPVQE